MLPAIKVIFYVAVFVLLVRVLSKEVKELLMPKIVEVIIFPRRTLVIMLFSSVTVFIFVLYIYLNLSSLISQALVGCR